MPGEVGRPSELNDELCLKIREFVLQGKTQREIAKLCEIAEETIESWIWRNYKGFADKYRLYKVERRLKKAEENIDDFLEMETKNTGVTKKGDTFEYDDAKLKKIKADTSIFVAETLGKEIYSKRSELTGKNGEALVPKNEVESLLVSLKQKNAIQPELTNGTVVTPARPTVGGSENVV